ncbi:oligosaccharide flippase family protein [Patescibacteria group bacterium]|nr:oligosaccharide flippase family protein [Patescibacteria group bacterium]
MFKFFKTKFFKGSLFLFASSTLTSAINYFYHLLLGRMLGPADYGTLASLISLTYLLGIPSAALSLVIMKFISSFHGKKKFVNIYYFVHRLVGKLFRLEIFLAPCLLIASPLVAKFLHTGSFLTVFLIFASSLIGVLSLVNNSALQGMLRFGCLSFLGIFSSLVKLLLSVLTVLIGWRVFGASLSFFLTALFGLALSRFFVGRVLRKPKAAVNLDVNFDKRALVKYALPVLFSTAAFTSLYTTDIILAKHFLVETEAGFYAGLANLGKIVFFASGPIFSVMFPLISRAFERGKNYRKIFGTSFLVVLSISLAVVLSYFIFPELMVKILYGDQYLPAARYLPLFGIFLGFYSLSYLTVNFFLSIREVAVVLFPVAAALVQILAILFFHQSLSQLISVSIFVLGILLALLLLYYLFKIWPKKKILNCFR